MGLTNRPYVGTYVPNRRKIIQYTPDALVYLNGDTGMAGCRTCRQRIDIQQFVTSVSVDAGVEAGASSSSISLSIPRHYGDSILRDGNTVLRNGLEVHIYFRGYFPMTGLATSEENIDGIPLEEVPQYPYYPVFHGIVTGVSHEYSGGYYTASLTCSGLLHFWQYMQISSSGSFFGARPENSGVRTNLRGHNLTGMTPYGIIYYLYRDTAGAAAGVGYALRSRTNFRSASSVTGDTLYSMTLRYWENRFAGGMYGLRMHGASGSLFTTAQQAFISRLNSNQGRLISVASPTGGAGSRRAATDPYIRTASLLNLAETSGRRILRGADLRLLAAANERDRAGVNVAQMQAFVNDISQYGQVNLFESTYESKLDIATQVTNVCGYEFYQDMDGDLVFKPPLYNLDTSSSRVYRIETEDIISISFNESEPEATYCIVKGGVFQNLRGAVDAAEWGCRGTYIDYRLVAQFGWRESSIESNYYNNARSAYYAAIANLDRVNKGVNSCSITIPLRPEIRPGYPVYIPNIDCFYYVESLSHSLSFGSSCTTTLTLVARRRKFFPPGNPNVEAESIDLSQTAEAPRALQYLDNSQQPRLLGFPNVVMALDPEHINPLFYAVGFLAEEAALREESASAARRRGESPTSVADLRDQFLTNMVMVLTQPAAPGGERLAPILNLVPPEGSAADGENRGANPRPTVASDPESEDDARDAALRGPWMIPDSDYTAASAITFDDLRNGLRSLLAVRSEARDRLRQIAGLIEREERNLTTATIRRGSSTSDSPNPLDEEIEARRNAIDRFRAEAEIINSFLQLNLRSQTDNFTDEAEESLFREFFTRSEFVSALNTKGLSSSVGRGGRRSRADEESTETVLNKAFSNLLLIMFLFQQVRERNPDSANRDMDLDATGTINNSGLLLELLGDRKASIGLNTPGYYRYYSCSHANPDQQGYISLASARTTEATPTKRVVIEDPFVITAGETPVERRIVIDEPFVIGPPTVSSSTTPTVAPSAIEPRGDGTVTTVTTVRNLNAVPEGFPPERRKDFVTLTDEVPVKGLNVRTFVSRNPTPTPSSEIFALSFETREARRYGSRTIVNVRRGAVTVLRDALSATGGTLGSNLGRSLQGNVEASLKTSPNTTASALVTAAVSGISNLNGANGNAITSTDIADGTPNANANPPVAEGSTTLQAQAGSGEAAALTSAADAILLAKGQRLISQVSQAYANNINQAIQEITQYDNLPNESRERERPARDRELNRLLRGWNTQLRRLFKDRIEGGPLGFSTQTGVFREALVQYSPVFPVSDALGYEHFGTYQYGRGLSIEPGGNYQRLMSLDPFQYVDRGLVDEFVRTLIRANGNLRDTSLNTILRQIASELESNQEPGADILVRRFREVANSEEGDSTTMIANGMANYIFSDRDAVAKMPVSNAAFLLSDIRPTESVGAGGCDCRGAEADLLLGSLMTGVDTTTFVSVEAQPNAGTATAEWTRNQMILASDGWAAAQAAMRGQFDGRGRSSLFDSVQGWQNAGQQLVAQFEGFNQSVTSTTSSGLGRLNTTAASAATAFNNAFNGEGQGE